MKNWKPKTGNPKLDQGFTIIEVTIAMFAFSIILTIIGSSFVSALNLQRRAFNAQKVEENITLIMEAMAREIRVSQLGGIDSSCPASPVSSLSIVHPVNGNVTYSLSGGAIHRSANGTDSIMSSSNVTFTKLNFCISGLIAGNQPRVTIFGSAKSTDTNNQISEDFQTTVSQRVLNPTP